MRKKQVDNINPFAQPQPITGGNAYQVHIATTTQDEMNKTTMMDKPSDITNIMKEIDEHVKDYIETTTPKWWILLQEQANYFCNQFQWNISDSHLKSQIINVIRCSFYNGIAGLYFNDLTGGFEAVVLSNVEYKPNGELQSAKYTHANYYLNGVTKKEHQEDFKGMYYIPENKIKNLAVFKWGTEATHAWLRILPYVKKQHLMMEMLNTQLFTYIKKFTYNCMNPSAAKAELAAFFNPKNPFIITTGMDGGGLNRFSEVKAGTNAQALELLDYYEKYMGIIYSQIGRRYNVDFKKERNISDEVQASQENYDILFKDTNAQFVIFVDNANKILSAQSKPSIEIFVDDVILREEEIKEDVDDFSNSESTDRHKTTD